MTHGLAMCSVVGKARLRGQEWGRLGSEVLAIAVPDSGLLAGEAGFRTLGRVIGGPALFQSFGM